MRVLAAVLAFSLVALPASAEGGGGFVHFKVECTEAAQAQFDLAMAHYHSFAWRAMREALERVLKADPSCGMAQWAHALASLGNPFARPRDIPPAALAEGPRILEEAARTGLRSERERAYVAALGAFFAERDRLDHRARARALEEELERLMERYPRDEEAATLYALFLSAGLDPEDRKHARQVKAAKILEKVFLDQPDHPGAAHYLIHTYDVLPLTKKGLEAAHRYAAMAPAAAHALHMPSHVFTRAGAWRESIEANRASVRLAEERSVDKWHAYDYLIYAHLQLGEHDAARGLVEEALKHPARVDHPATAYAYAAMPARVALGRAAWKEAASLDLLPGFPWSKYPHALAVNAYARGIGSAMSGDAALARGQAERLEALRAQSGEPYWAEQIAIQGDVVKALALLVAGQSRQGIAALRAAAKREDATRKHVVMPGPLLPAREILAYALLESGEPRAALREFEAVLEKEPNRLRALAGAVQAAERSGSRGKAKLYGSKLPI